MMRTLYIDHSIVAHEPSWEHLRQASTSGKLRLALSVWNLVEIGSATDETQRESRLAFLESLSPVWVVERLAIQKQEVERFLWSHKFGATPRDLIAITPSLTVVDSFFAGSHTRIGLTARQFIRGIDFAALQPVRRLSPDALRTLQGADRKVLRAKKREIFDAWIAPLIPDRGPDGRALTIAEKAELLASCWAGRKQFLAECPCLAVEDVLTTARTADPTRNPTDSDGPDLQHAAVALAYCDVFFSRDGYQGQCAGVARRSLKTMDLAVVCSTPVELAAAADAF
jgi:hypothetical protein